MLVILLDIFETEKNKNDYIINLYKNIISISFSKKFLNKDKVNLIDKIKIYFIKLKLRSIIKKMNMESNASYVFSKAFEKSDKFKALVLANILNVFDNLYVFILTRS